MVIIPLLLIPFNSILPMYAVGHIDNYNCPEHLPAMVEAGWSLAELQQVDAIVWAETRCQSVVSDTHDYGLMQVNRKVWRSTIEDAGATMQDLLDPVTGLRWGKYVSEQAEVYGWCKWQPWYMSGNWC